MDIYKVPGTAGDYFIDTRDILYIYKGSKNGKKYTTGTIFLKNGSTIAITLPGQIDRILNDWLEYKSKILNNGG